MPTLVRPWIVTYLDSSNRRVPKGTCGARKRRTRSSKWYGQGIPGLPPKKRVPLATDKAVARRMLDDLVRGAERGQVNLPDADAGRTSLADHLEAFARDMALGLGSRRRRTRQRPSPIQIHQTLTRVRNALAGSNLKSIADLNSAAPAKLAAYLDARVKLKRIDGGMSYQTAEHYLKSVNQFIWWLSAKANAPVRPDLFADLPGYDPKLDKKHARRDVTPEELGRILATTRAGKSRFRMTGEDRYHLYLTAFGTGFRAEELSKLCPEHFDLDASPPTVVLANRDTKNKKGAQQPLPPGVASQLRSYLRGRKAGQPVWPTTPCGWIKNAAGMFEADLAVAGVPYRIETPDGPRFADFHALRHSFLSALAGSGVGVKELQELARHASPKLTLGVYTHTRPEQLGAAVARLPLPGANPDPVAEMTRDQLESLAVVLLNLFAGLFAPPLAPDAGIGGDSRTLAGTKRRRKRAG